MQWFSRFAKDQDQRSWLLHQATKTTGFDHLLLHHSHFLALHTACSATLCQMSNDSSGSYCHAYLISSCIPHITGLYLVQNACTHANIMLAFIFHATLTCILTRRIWPGLLVGGDRRPEMGLLGLHKFPRWLGTSVGISSSAFDSPVALVLGSMPSIRAPRLKIT